MKKTILLAAFAAVSLCISAQENDPVLMTVDGKDVTRSEFEYSFNKNNSDGVIDRKTVEEYVPLYAAFKLKVAEAEHQRVDTIARVRRDLDSYKEQMLLPMLVDTAYVEREARRTYENTASRYGGEDVLTASHILVLLRQDADAERQAAAKARIDSIYEVLRAVPQERLAVKFAEMAKAKSDDRGSAARGGALGQFGRGRMIPDFEREAFALKVGEMSAPFLSTVGYHIIYMENRRPFGDYAEHRAAILDFLDRRGVREASANAYLDSLATQRGVGRTEVVDELYRHLLDKNVEQKNLAREYREGTLMYEVTKKDVWDKAQHDEKGQEAYFQANKNDYKWDEPRFCGIVVHAKDAETMAKAKKAMKGVPEENWATAVVKAVNVDSVQVVRVERGVFKQGDNANVDVLVFKQKDKKMRPMEGFPVVEFFGKKAKAPRSARDVRAAVVRDYQDACERAWVEELKGKYSVKVYDDVVKTVNKH